MTSTDICNIIRCGCENKVIKLELGGGVNIHYGSNIEQLKMHADDEYFASLETPDKIDDNETYTKNDDGLNIQELAYSDPERYERIMQGDIDA